MTFLLPSVYESLIRISFQKEWSGIEVRAGSAKWIMGQVGGRGGELMRLYGGNVRRNAHRLLLGFLSSSIFIGAEGNRNSRYFTSLVRRRILAGGAERNLQVLTCRKVGQNLRGSS